MDEVAWQDGVVTPFRIALTQPTVTADPRCNGQKARDLMCRAADQRARLVLFPEGFLSGYAKEQVADWDHVEWVAVRGFPTGGLRHRWLPVRLHHLY
jgi:hypothetical protein